MGIFDRFRAARIERPDVQQQADVILGGDEDLEVVGEANYQATLWQLCGAVQGERVRHAVHATLVREPSNPYDPNAVAVHVQGRVVGYLKREDAARYAPGIEHLTRQYGTVMLPGVIVGGGYREDGLGRLGIWLKHDPQHFGLRPRRGAVGSQSSSPSQPLKMRTGFTEASLTDPEDDTYDLGWFDTLPDGDRPAIARLRELLAVERDPLDRHFQFAELESRLYRSRDLYPEALDEYDAACVQHDAEMEVICAAFRAKWGKVPMLDTYRQMAIRQQKAGNWQACLRWAERGLALYGDSPARVDAVEDLEKRRNRALAKLSEREPKTNRRELESTDSSAPATPSGLTVDLESLTCTQCGAIFERPRTRGRKPSKCPGCR